MDKIDLANWHQYFGASQQQLVHSSERYQHFTLQFQQKGLATGKVNAINTPGMLFSELYMEADQSFSLYDAVPKETAESVFVLQGDVESRFDNLPDPICFGRQQHNIQYNTNFSGTHVIHSRRFHACTITYHTDYLNSLVEDDPGETLGLFSQHLNNKTHFLGAANGLCWQERIAALIHSIGQCPFAGITRYIFTESKLMELFVLQMDQVHAIHSNAAREYWSPADKEKLYAVKEFIARSYLEPLSLKALTRQFALNEFKLKKGYKYFFQTTVFGDIHRLRMQQARHLLSERMMNVTEVAWHIGYNNVSSFSHAFKKVFGFNPGSF
jgi:AraC family transcriptional regulator, transcriptional activator of the genes for pyochelin and ferripyochelin receptors